MWCQRLACSGPPPLALLDDAVASGKPQTGTARGLQTRKKRGRVEAPPADDARVDLLGHRVLVTGKAIRERILILRKQFAVLHVDRVEFVGFPGFAAGAPADDHVDYFLPFEANLDGAFAHPG